MTKIKRFEDIDAWKAARELTKDIYQLACQSKFAKDFGLRDQIQRATVSIMANIAEGFDSSSDEGFIRFLRYGLRSATEVQSHLYVALDQEYINADDFNHLYKQADKVKNLISGFVRYLRK